MGDSGDGAALAAQLGGTLLTLAAILEDIAWNEDEAVMQELLGSCVEMLERARDVVAAELGLVGDAGTAEAPDGEAAPGPAATPPVPAAPPIATTPPTTVAVVQNRIVGYLEREARHLSLVLRFDTGSQLRTSLRDEAAALRLDSELLQSREMAK